jgi:hypothetical protein
MPEPDAGGREAAGARSLHPDCEEKQRRAGIDEAGRNPHDQPGKLLVLQRRHSPLGRPPGLQAIENVRRKRDYRAENAGVQHRREQMSGRDARVAAAHQRPPEQQPGHQKTDVLEPVQPDMRHRGVEQLRYVPSPDRDAVNDRRRDGVGQTGPGQLQPRAAQHRRQGPAQPRRQCPGERPPGRPDISSGAATAMTSSCSTIWIENRPVPHLWTGDTSASTRTSQPAP